MYEENFIVKMEKIPNYVVCEIESVKYVPMKLKIYSSNSVLIENTNTVLY